MIPALQNSIEENYELQLQLKPLAGELDLNFLGQTEAGEKFIVKVMRENCPESLIDLQTATLRHLEKTIQQIKLPKVVLTQEGTTYTYFENKILWVLTYCEGTLLADFRPHTEELIFSFGEAIAHLTNSLEGFEHPTMKRGFYWEMTKTLEVKPYIKYVNESIKQQVQDAFDQFEIITYDQLIQLPYSVIHNDANDYNVLIAESEQGEQVVNALFDFGDMSYQPTICELAIALAYLIFGKEQPISIIATFLKGYTSIRSLTEQEIDILLDLIEARLAVSIATSSYRQTQNPDDAYITISQQPAIEALDRLSKINKAFALTAFRQACGYPVTKSAAKVLAYLQSPTTRPFPVMQVDSYDCMLDLSVGSKLLGASPSSVALPVLSSKIDRVMVEQEAKFSIGRYSEYRHLYAAAGFGHGNYPTGEKRVCHIGLDIFCDAGLPVFAPFDGVVQYASIIDLPLDYGGMVVLKHEIDTGEHFYTLYGHLSHDILNHISVGQSIKAGDQIATLGEATENGGWPPHLHLQIIVDLLDKGIHFPGVALDREAVIYKALCPNPALLLEVDDISKYDATPPTEQLLARRKQRLGYNLSISYKKPLHIVKGYLQYLYDSKAQTYLDVYNNVPHVGHQHPEVVKAIQEQTALLTTNTRYLHETILNYADRLVAKMPKGLEVCYFVNSASEANELAIRMARAYTRKKDMLVVEGAYHGHTNTLIDISPYKHDGPGGSGAPDWVHTVPVADDYRGKYKRDNVNCGKLYAKEVQQKLQQLARNGTSIAAFIAETYPSVGGQIITPPNYLKNVYQFVRARGGLCIADEVQTGFGRLGESFWAFETQEAIPDMVILGKPIANGYPMGAVVTTKAIAEAFDNGMEFFSTFGGNPVACAAATAVLDVIEEDKLQQNAIVLGKQFLDRMNKLKRNYEWIGDVRGEGFFLGIELVKDRETLTPAAKAASYIKNRLRDHHILAGTDGPLHNVLKFRPSMVLTARDMEFLLTSLEQIFHETPLRE